MSTIAKSFKCFHDVQFWRVIVASRDCNRKTTETFEHGKERNEYLKVRIAFSKMQGRLQHA